MHDEMADLYSRDLTGLIQDLSMSEASDDLRSIAGDNEVEPYRRVLKDLRDELIIFDRSWRQDYEATAWNDQVAYVRLLTYLIRCS